MDKIREAPTYIKVFGALTVLTLIEIWVARAPAAQALIVASLIALAVAKAALVALYYMHLRYEKRLLWYVALSPFVLSFILTAMVAADSTLKAP